MRLIISRSRIESENWSKFFQVEAYFLLHFTEMCLVAFSHVYNCNAENVFLVVTTFEWQWFSLNALGR